MQSGRHRVHVEKPALKEALNRRKHGIGFSLADVICNDPLSITVYDRFENGEDRWHTFGTVKGVVFVVVHTYPDPEDDQWVRVIGLRKATAQERKNYEERRLD
jgi:uncharacterized DUF497 family protein